LLAITWTEDGEDRLTKERRLRTDHRFSFLGVPSSLSGTSSLPGPPESSDERTPAELTRVMIGRRRERCRAVEGLSQTTSTSSPCRAWGERHAVVGAGETG
jgi:hypothetical protein